VAEATAPPAAAHDADCWARTMLVVLMLAAVAIE
jgi:hypothetical protein